MHCREVVPQVIVIHLVSSPYSGKPLENSTVLGLSVAIGAMVLWGLDKVVQEPAGRLGVGQKADQVNCDLV